ncbi:POTE ankyrin domain family member A [Phodopus roborovskii]|uniref:POTE ankyrin domain family member A n=1 Tax=Phodopus roborovskii TaxID=109678 RepID=UPI0021E4E908|nr:POTE ankyrin domain family member A [Phodopus roborovskii]
MAFAMKKIFGVKEKTPFGFCDGPQMSVSEFFFGECPNYPKYHTTYRPAGQIHRVAAEGDAGRMEILITLGQCSVFDRDHKNRTALHFACVYGRLPVVNVLVNNNCEIDALDKNHITPLMKSVQCWKQKCAAVLLEHGANPNIRDDSGNCALHYAVYNGHEEMASLLLEYHADIEQKTKDGFTPLLLALRERRVEVAEFLVKKGADVHVVDDMQRNTLIYAIRCGSKDMATLLLQKGIDFFYKDVFGWTALRYAIEGHCTFRQMLLDFEENIHNNKNDSEPEEQMDSGNDSLVGISSCPDPGPPLPAMKEDDYNSDTKSISERAPLNCASNPSVATDKIFENTEKRKMEAWVEEDLSLKPATEVRESVTNEGIEIIELLPSVPELELMSVEEDMFDESENNQPLSVLEHLPQMSVGHLPDAGYEMGKINTNRQEKVEPDLEVTSEEDHNELDDRRNIQSLRIYEDVPNISGNASVAADSRREKTSGQATESLKEYRLLMNICKQVHTQNVGYLSMAKDQRGEKIVTCVEKVSLIFYDMSGVNKYLISKHIQPTIEENYSDPNEVTDIKNGKWFQEVNYMGLSAESAGKVTSEGEQNCHDDPQKEQRVSVLKGPQPRNIAYLSMANDESRENTTECQEEESSEHLQWKSMQPTIEREDSASSEVSSMKYVKSLLTAEPTIKASEQEWCGGRNIQRQFILTNYMDLLESDVLLSSEEEQEWSDDCEGEHLKQPQPRGIAHLSTAKDERGEDVISDEEKRAKTVQLMSEEEQTGWCSSNKKQWKPIFEQFQLKRNARVSVNPEKHVKNTGAAEERGATTVQLRPKTEQTGRFGSNKKQWKPIFGRFQPKWSARVFMGPEESGENTGAAEEKGATTIQLKPKTEQTGKFGSDKKQQKPIFERFQPKWSARVFMGPKESRENTGAAEEKGAAMVQLRPEEEETKWNDSDQKHWKPVFERFQPKWSARVSVGPRESRENTGAAEEKESSLLSPTEEQTGCHGSEKPRLHILEQFQPKWSVRVCVETKQGGDNADAAQMTYSSDEHTELKTTTEEQDSAPIEDPTMKHEIFTAEEDLQMESKEKQRSHGYENIQSVVEKTKTHASIGIDIAEYPHEGAVFTAAASTAAAAAAAADVTASAMDELVLQRKSGEINNQRVLIKDKATHDRFRKKTSKKKHKITKEVRAMGDTTQSSESVSEDDSGSSLKIQDSLNPYNSLVDLKKINEVLREKNQKMENENTALQKEISETREEKSKLQDEIVKRDEEFWNLRFTLRKELEETRNIHCFYKNIKKHLSEKEKQFNERVAVTQLEVHLRTRDMELKNARDSLKELQEAQDQHIQALKAARKMKDHLQRIELEHSELKVKVKEQAKKIEELRGCLQNSCEKLEQDEKLTQAQETSAELHENTIHPPMNETGIRIQSLQSEPSQMKTLQESNTSALKSYEQQCIEELRISNALLYERYNLYRNRRLNESCTQVHITVEQDTPLNTLGTRFALESPCVASTCPCRPFFQCENMILPGNPGSSNDCMQSYPMTMEDEEKSIKELTELKQYLKYNLYQQKKKNDELEKEIIRIKKFLKMRKIGHEIGECSSHRNSRTGHF